VLFHSPAWDEVTYWALDLETGGLDPRRDAILAVGMVPVRHGTIRVGEAFRTLVRPEEGLRVDASSVRAHQLLMEEVMAAPPLAEVLPEVERRLGDGVLLVHHRPLDEGFLKQAYARLGRRWPRPPVVDTVDLLMKLARRRQRQSPDLPADPPARNLTAARRLLGLPAYAAHDPAVDAISAAELFLVLRDQLGARTVRDLR